MGRMPFKITSALRIPEKLLPGAGGFSILFTDTPESVTEFQYKTERVTPGLPLNELCEFEQSLNSSESHFLPYDIGRTSYFRCGHVKSD